jgi:alpha-tubulin suppressor-like RCC1 family protein
MFGSRNFLFAKASAAAAQFKLFSWGRNISGELGLGNTTYYSSPKQVGLLTDWATPAAGERFSICVKTTGQLWSWGLGSYGRLGIGNTTDYSSPKQIGNLATWEKSSAAKSNGACIKTDGTLWTWGQGGYGAIGDGDLSNRSSPVQIGSSTTWTAVSVGTGFMLAVDNGKLFAWGRNDGGQLGQGNLTNTNSPVQVGLLTNWATPAAGSNQSDLSQFSLCVKTDGTLWAWGLNNYGQLAQNNTTNRSSPVQVGLLTDWAKPAAGTNFAICTKTDGTLWSWGRNYQGGLGLGNLTNYSSPKQIGALTSWVMPSAGGASTSSGFGLCTQTNGTLWAWGSNNFGQLGIGNTSNRSSPVQVSASTTWTKVDVGNTHTEAVQGVETAAPISLTNPVVSGTAIEGRTLASSYGTWSNFPSSFTFQWQRGTTNISGATSNFYLVVAADIGSTLRCVVTGINSFGSASANSANTATVTAFTGGQLWTWGYNANGQIGNSTTTNYSSPIQIGSSTTWTRLFGGFKTMFAINAATELYAWGRQQGNAFFGGALGIGTIYSVSSPVQVSGTGWETIAGNSQNIGTTAGIKTNGELWTWGYSGQGQLGRTGGTSSVPVQVGTLTAWKEVSGTYNSFMAIKTDGTLWGWGGNGQGELGLGNTTTYSSPVQVGALTNWKFISGAAGGRRFQAIKTDGTLWGWGVNSDGTLGTGNTTNFSSPVQIGALTNWAKIQLGAPASGTGGNAFATKTDGSAWVWGTNTAGVLGLGNTTSYSSPKLLSSGDWINAIIGTGNNSCIVAKANGSLWSWGQGTYGQTGQGILGDLSTPTQIGSLNTWRSARISNSGRTGAGIKIP